MICVHIFKYWMVIIMSSIYGISHYGSHQYGYCMYMYVYLTVSINACYMYRYTWFSLAYIASLGTDL